MASSNYIQKIFAADESGVGEGSTENSRRRQTEIALVGFSSIASTTLTLAAGDVVVWDFVNGGTGEVGQLCKKSAANGAATGVVVRGGSSLTDALAAPLTSDKIEVCVGGLCEAKVKGSNAAGNTPIASGDYLCQSDSAGILFKYTAGTDALPIAIAVDDVASGASAANVSILLLKQW